MDDLQNEASIQELTHLFANASYAVSNVHLKLEMELQRIFPDDANAMDLYSRFGKVQGEFVSLCDEFYDLFDAKLIEPIFKMEPKRKPKKIEKECVSNKRKPNAVKKRAPDQFEVIRAPNQFRVIPAPDQFEVIRAPNQFKVMPAPDQFEVIRAPNQFRVVPAPDQCEMEVERSGVSLKFHEDAAKHEDDGGAQDNHDEYNQGEGSDDLEDIGATKDDPIVSPKPSTVKRKSKDNTNRKTGGKKLCTDASPKEDIHSLVQITSAKSAAMPSCHSPCSGPTLEKCFGILQRLPGVVPQSNIWNYACNFISKKEVRSMFVLQPDDEARLSWLEFNYELAMKENPYVIY